jgi:phospholipid/cholesterol/gamma-HCH transport system substrate-binding protein
LFVAVGLAAAGLEAVAARQGFGGTVELTVGVPDAGDVQPGTPVRLRGVEVGQVVGVEYPEDDGPNSAVTVRMRVPSRFAPRLFADATAQVQPTGLLGGRVVAIQPGTPKAGPLADGRLKFVPAADLAQTAAKVGELADEARKLLADVRAENGLYQELKGLTAEARQAVKKADRAIGTVEGEAAGVRQLVQDGRDTLKSVKQGTDAVQRLPIIRGYVEDQQALLVRPTFRRQAFSYQAHDLFEPGTAILTDAGKEHLSNLAAVLRTQLDKRAEVVVSAGGEPATTPNPGPLTRQRAEVAVAFLKEKGAHKMGWWTRRSLTPVGLGSDPDPVPDPDRPAGPWVQVLVFTPA